MENLLLDMYNQNLANQATNLYNQRQRDLVNQAAMDVFSTGFQNRGILNTQPAMAFNDYYGPTNIDTSFGVANEPDEEDEEQSFLNMITGGVQNISDKLGISSIIGAFNPLAGLVSRGIGAFSPSFVGPKGSRGYDSDTTLGLFARSNTLADFFQNVRDKKAREAAAARGAAKQAAIAASQQVDTGDSGAGSSFDAPSGGTFGSSVNDAGSFSDYS